MPTPNNPTNPIHLVPDNRNWFEGAAVDALHHVATLPGMGRVVGFPDMHPGKPAPNGAAFLSMGQFYPHLVGNDIGCGYGLWQTDLRPRKLKLERWSERVADLDQPWDGDFRAVLNEAGLPATNWDDALGTIGGGNHFAELLDVHQVADPEVLHAAGLAKDSVFILVHSGSRGLGQSIMRRHAEAYGGGALTAGSPEALDYLQAHDHAVAWAKLSRARIAQRFAEQIHTDLRPVLDLPHNLVTPITLAEGTGWLHRKGVSPSGQGLVVIPGSRGTLTYLVQPLRDDAEHLWSLSHGAGRKWDRHATEARLRERFRKEQLIHTELGGHVICEDKALLFQEAPEAYKSIDKVIAHLRDVGLIQVVATLRPLLTYKQRNIR